MVVDDRFVIHNNAIMNFIIDYNIPGCAYQVMVVTRMRGVPVSCPAPPTYSLINTRIHMSVRYDRI